MTQITASLVKELRERTGAGMMDCKKALTESGGNLEAAADWLRTKGLAAAAKKSSRVAAEGLIGIATAERAASMVEINSETDFVSRNEEFQAFVSAVAGVAIDCGGNLEDLAAAAHPETSRSVADQVTHMISILGENMNLRRTAALAVDEGAVAAYIHGALSPGLGRIGVIVGLKSSGDAAKVAAFGKQLAMHIAATNPQAVNVAELDADIVQHEREVLSGQARESGKPENIIEKMVEGRLRKFYQEIVLTEQTFVIDNETKVADAIEAAGQDAGAQIEITGFARFVLGEGVEKKETDFAAEVAAQAVT